MSLRVFQKDGTNVVLTAPLHAKPFPGDENFIAGVAADGNTIVAVIPVVNCVGVQEEN